MKPEPLLENKAKNIPKDIKKDIVSAIKWFLQELDKLDLEELEEFAHEHYNKFDMRDADVILEEAKDYVSCLIKEAFEGVLKKEDV